MHRSLCADLRIGWSQEVSDVKEWQSRNLESSGPASDAGGQAGPYCSLMMGGTDI